MVSESKSAEGAAFGDVYAEALAFEVRRDLLNDQSRTTAWRVASVAVVVAFAAVIGLSFMAPLKSVVPYLYLVDKVTGHTELVSAGGDRGMVEYRELIDKHWVSKYVVARESYNYRLLQKDYDMVLLLSDDDVGRAYAAKFEGPKALDKVLGESVERRVDIISVTPSPDATSSKAVVRYTITQVRTDTNSASPPEHFVATLAYHYKPSLFGREALLIANPEGFKVSGWRRDAELVGGAVAR